MQLTTVSKSHLLICPAIGELAFFLPSTLRVLNWALCVLVMYMSDTFFFTFYIASAELGFVCARYVHE
uniref:Uncharacterized protein n=1 Tax=Aegilops tauschii subsp. strangulata TaxID=200361 RepID=A0A453I4N9_AEGTS